MAVAQAPQEDQQDHYDVADLPVMPLPGQEKQRKEPERGEEQLGGLSARNSSGPSKLAKQLERPTSLRPLTPKTKTGERSQMEETSMTSLTPLTPSKRKTPGTQLTKEVRAAEQPRHFRKQPPRSEVHLGLKNALVKQRIGKKVVQFKGFEPLEPLPALPPQPPNRACKHASTLPVESDEGGNQARMPSRGCLALVVCNFHFYLSVDTTARISQGILASL